MPSGSSIYAEYIQAQVEREEERKKSLESRGVTVITSSGTLATLLLGLVAIATRAEATFDLPDGARLPLGLALGAFTVAALLAIITNIPLLYQEAKLEGLEGVVDHSLADSEDEARETVARNMLRVLSSAREKNRIKAWALCLALGAEAVAVGFLAWAMLEILEIEILDIL